MILYIFYRFIHSDFFVLDEVICCMYKKYIKKVNLVKQVIKSFRIMYYFLLSISRYGFCWPSNLHCLPHLLCSFIDRKFHPRVQHF